MLADGVEQFDELFNISFEYIWINKVLQSVHYFIKDFQYAIPRPRLWYLLCKVDTFIYNSFVSKKILRFLSSFHNHNIHNEDTLCSANRVLPVFLYRHVTMSIIRFQDCLKRFGVFSASSRWRLSATSYKTSASCLITLSSDRHCIKPSVKTSTYLENFTATRKLI